MLLLAWLACSLLVGVLWALAGWVVGGPAAPVNPRFGAEALEETARGAIIAPVLRTGFDLEGVGTP